METIQQIKDDTAPYFVGATNRFKPYITIYDDGGFIICQGTWVNDDKSEEKGAYAMRWYSGDGKGYPNGYGHAQWMVVPNQLGRTVHIDGLKNINFKELSNAA